MPIDFESPEWRVRVMQDKADVLGYQVRLLWMAEQLGGPKQPWIQFLELDDRSFIRKNDSGSHKIFQLDEAEKLLEAWLTYYNETGCKPLI